MFGTRFVRVSPRKGLLLLVVIGVLAVIANPAPAAAKPRADFTVRLVGCCPTNGGPLFLFDLASVGNTLDYFVRVKNVGEARGRGHGVLRVLGEGELLPLKYTFDVPRLKPGHATKIDVDIRRSELGDINFYTTKGCAHARRDPHPGNNCHTGPPFSIIPQTWVGTTNSTENLSGGEVVTCGTNVTFSYDFNASGAGKFVYKGTGSLSCTASGSSGGCTFAGSADLSIEKFITTLFVQTHLTDYNGIGASSKSFDGTRTCMPDPPEPWSFDVGAWLVTRSSQGMETTDTQLSGSYPLGEDSYSWSLNAE